MIRFIFYNIIAPLNSIIFNFLSKSRKKEFFKWFITKNNEFVLHRNNKKIQKILILIPKCLQNSKCVNNLVDSIENCKMCGRCKIKNLVEIKKNLEKYINIEIKMASGGKIARFYVENIKPDYVIAIACDKELLEGIRDTKSHNVLAISNIIVEKPCINTDVDTENIKYFLNQIIK